ncbi:MAG: hypothetical protein WCC64_01580 [Aliidongia sp.]
MATVNIMIPIDVETAIATANGGNITSGLYMIDTTGYVGTAEGSVELKTPCNAGDILVWTVYPINPSDNVKITGFTGTAPSNGTFQNLESEKTPNGVPYWTCAINLGAPTSTVQYSITFQMSGRTYSYDPYVAITAN